MDSDFENRQISALIDQVSSLPPGPDVVAPKPIDDVTTTVCACNKVKAVNTMPRRHSGHVHYIDNVCDGCESISQGLATIICARCRHVVGRIEPTTDLTGFKFERGKVYHSDACPTCKPELTSSTIVEKVIYDRRTQKKP